MARQVTILRVFVASTADLTDERVALERVARELNQTLSERCEAYLEIINWQTHAWPGVASDPQAVINEEIADNYEIFIGILSTRFGSPTPRAGSGTEEELERAYHRFKDNPSHLRVMFYFKDPVVKASELNLEEYSRVVEFQKRLGGKGVLYWTFTTTEDFATFLRMHLSRQLQEWADKRWGNHDSTKITEDIGIRSGEVSAAQSEVEDELELGYLDLIDIGTEKMENATATLVRMVNAITILSEKVEENTPRLSEAGEKNDSAKAKQIMNYVAQVMEEYAQRMDTELPIFSQSFSSAMDAISRAATLWESDFKSEDKSVIESVYDQNADLVVAMTTAGQSMLTMQEAVLSVPRLTTAFNKARKHAYQALENFNRELEGALNLTLETQKELKRILEG